MISPTLHLPGCDGPITPADEKIIGRCAWIAGRHASPGMTRDDMLQEGRAALFIARRNGLLPADDLHRARYIARRVLGAMLDANSAAWRQQPFGLVELNDDDDDDGGERAGPQVVDEVDGPDRICEIRQAVARLLRRGSKQLIECVTLLGEGHDIKAVALVLGVDASRVSHLKADARRLVARCW